MPTEDRAETPAEAGTQDGDDSPSGRPPPVTDSHGATSHATPTKPSNRPATVSNVGRFPPGQDHSISTMKSGLMPMISAVSPEGMDCSAHATSPLPPTSKNTPTTALRPHWAAVGQGAPCHLTHASRIGPATRNRRAVIANGGMVSMA